MFSIFAFGHCASGQFACCVKTFISGVRASPSLSKNAFPGTSTFGIADDAWAPLPPVLGRSRATW